MKFGICTPFRDILDLHLKEVTFDYLEENVQRFLIPERPQEDFEAQLHEAQRLLPLPIETANSFLPPDLTLVATPERPVDAGRLERYIKTALQRAEQSGIRVIVFGSGDARKCPPDYNHQDAKQQIADHLAIWSRWAREHGVTIVLEPLRYEETNILNTVAESGALVSSIAASGARLLADTYHMSCNREDPETILPWASILAHVHVAELQDRAAPGHYGEDFKPYFSALQRAGYNQRISIECRWFDFGNEIDPALAALREQWAISSQQN